MQIRRKLSIVAAALALLLPRFASAQVDLRSALQMKTLGPAGLPLGWGGGPAGTVAADSLHARSAPYAVRIQRGTESEGRFSSATMRVPLTFTGDTVELDAWVRTRDVAGWAGLWLREDGPAGPVQFQNMQNRPVAGTTEWTRYTIRLPLDRRARAIYAGALLAGRGTAWMDDVQLLVDGRPVWDAPAKAAPPAQSDHEFDRGSRISLSSLSPAQQANLVVLGKVWGFVKYHHPRIARGEVNWDYELFRVLPAVLAAPDRATADQAMVAWLARLGDPPACSACAQPAESAQLAPEIGWIHDRNLLGPELSDRLEAIYRDRFASGEQYYVGQMPSVGNPTFENEESYPAQASPDGGYRLLALYRFWNIVEYWFPYRDVLGEDWNGVLAEFIPRMVAASDSTTYRLALMQLMARVHDTHANLWGELSLRPPRGPAQLPVVVRFVEGKAVVAGYTDPALGRASGLQPGDVIESIDGAPVDSLVAAWRPYYAASNEPTRLRDMARFLTRGPAGPVRLVVRRGSELLHLSPERVPATQLGRTAGFTHDLPGEAFHMLTDEVAYLKLSGVSAAAIPDYLRRAAGAKVLVVDIRNYPKEFVVFSLGGHFVDRPTPFARFTVGNLANPGEFAWSPVPMALRPLPPRFNGKLVILVDETSQSQAEYTTMAFRAAPDALVVGSTTAGADGNVSRIPLPGAVAGMMSGIGVFYPDRRATQRIGIVPDLEVKPTIAGIRDGRDEVLEAAVSAALGKRFRLPREAPTAARPTLQR